MAVLMIDSHTKHLIDRAIMEARARPIPMEFLRDTRLPDKDHLTFADLSKAPKRPHPPQQVMIPVGYLAAVSFEHQPPGLMIHLSISVERKDPQLMPSVPAVKVIAKAFGITYPGDSMWTEEYAPGRRAVNIVQLIEETHE